MDAARGGSSPPRTQTESQRCVARSTLARTVCVSGSYDRRSPGCGRPPACVPARRSTGRAHEVAEYFDDGDDLLLAEARSGFGFLFDWRVPALFSTLASGLSSGDPAGDHGRVGAGFECRSISGPVSRRTQPRSVRPVRLGSRLACRHEPGRGARRRCDAAVAARSPGRARCPRV